MRSTAFATPVVTTRSAGDGVHWAADCCGGWAQGVNCYAGVNVVDGANLPNGKDMAISPTGEKSYGSVKLADVGEVGMTFGAIVGQPPGTPYVDYAAMIAAGVHRQKNVWMVGGATNGTESIVLNGGCVDEIIYPGFGGRDSSGR